MAIWNVAAYLKRIMVVVLVVVMSVTLNGWHWVAVSVGFAGVNGREGREKCHNKKSAKEGRKKRRNERRRRMGNKMKRRGGVRWKCRSGWSRDRKKMTGAFCAFLRDQRYIIYTLYNTTVQ